MNMQRFQPCKKIVTLLLTICMILPLMLNQYLMVHAAEPEGESETVTKTLADLAEASDYEEIDMTAGKEVSLNDLKFSEEKYQYEISTSTNIKDPKTACGKLVKMKVGAGQTILFQADIENKESGAVSTSRYFQLYNENDLYHSIYSSEDTQGYTNKDKKDQIIYVWIVRPTIEGVFTDQTKEYECTVSFTYGKDITEYLSNAKPISLDQEIDFDETADNFVTPVLFADHTYGCYSDFGWLLKNEKEEAVTYELTLSDSSCYTCGSIFDKNGNYTNQFSSFNGSTNIILPEGGYVLLSKKLGNYSVQCKYSFHTVKDLSEEETTLLEKDVIHTVKTTDKTVNIYGEQRYTYKITLNPNEQAAIQTTSENGYFSVYNADRTLERDGYSSFSNTDSEIVYYTMISN